MINLNQCRKCGGKPRRFKNRRANKFFGLPRLPWYSVECPDCWQECCAKTRKLADRLWNEQNPKEKNCDTCGRIHSMPCPNSNKCYETKDRPYYIPKEDAHDSH